MESTTNKHREFLEELIKEKSVTELPGIGAVSGKKLTKAGFGKAYNVLGLYLVVNKDETKFKAWLNTFGIDSKGSQACYECFQAWCGEHL